MIERVAIVVYSYPTIDDPVYAFIRPVACGLADLGIHVSVLSPQSITNSLKRKVRIRPYKWEDYTDEGNTVFVYQPPYISVSMLRYKGKLLSRFFFERALKKAYRMMKTKPDILYTHFWESAVAASNSINEEIPIVAVSGENHITVFDNYPKEQVDFCKKRVKGLICVSTKNYEECKGLDLISKEMKTIVLPNAVDNKVFKKIDKTKARNELGWNNDSVIAIFVGEFSERKGVNRLIDAAKQLPDLNLVLIGRGDELNESNQILFSGVLPHEEIPVYLNAADFFVLPTLAEGCCNAIIEALACGLPIISSDMLFNKDVLNERNSILVNPNDIDQIADAMRKLINNSRVREELSKGALYEANELKISSRVGKINDFINSLALKDSL